MDAYDMEQKNSSDTEVWSKLEALDIEWQIFFIILYSLTSFLALFENLIVIFVQMFGKSFDPMLRKCLINLAIADIFKGVLSVPFQYTDFMLGRWVFPHFMCPVSQFAVLLSVFITCHTLTLISFERYISIVHPIFHSTHSQQIQLFSTTALAIEWLLGSILSGISLNYSKIKSFTFEDTVYYDCRTHFSTELIQKAYILSIFIFTFALPLLLQTTLHSLIVIKLKDVRGTVSRHKIKIIKMLSILVITFAVCWLPIRLFFVTITFNRKLIDLKTTTAYHIYVFTFFGVHFLAMFNSCINPIIYCFMSKAFRDDIRYLLNKFKTTRITQIRLEAIFGSSLENIPSI